MIGGGQTNTKKTVSKKKQKKKEKTLFSGEESRKGAKELVANPLQNEEILTNSRLDLSHHMQDLSKIRSNQPEIVTFKNESQISPSVSNDNIVSGLINTDLASYLVSCEKKVKENVLKEFYK